MIKFDIMEENKMSDHISFARETLRLERQYNQIHKDFLIFANQKVAKADISDADKFRLLSSFLGDYASETAIITGHCYVTRDLPDQLMELHDSIEKSFELRQKLDLIDYQMSDNARRWSEWTEANSPKSPLLPN